MVEKAIAPIASIGMAACVSRVRSQLKPDL
jgi:hypothetical protein